jgi:hypothetical protein
MVFVHLNRENDNFFIQRFESIIKNNNTLCDALIRKKSL